MALNPKTSPFRHSIAWLVSFVLESYRFFKYFPSYSNKEFLLIFYNYVSLVIVFYCIAFALQGYFKKISWPTFWELHPNDMLSYLIKPRLLIVPIMVTVYLFTAVMMDRAFSLYPYDNFDDHIDGRWCRIKPYVAGAIMYALYRVGKSKHKSEILAARKQIDELIARVFKIKELENRYAKKDEYN